MRQTEQNLLNLITREGCSSHHEEKNHHGVQVTFPPQANPVSFFPQPNSHTFVAPFRAFLLIHSSFVHDSTSCAMDSSGER